MTIDSLVLVTVSGTKHFNRDYSQQCIPTWDRITGVQERRMVSDGLTAEDIARAGDAGIECCDRNPEQVLDSLADRPALQVMREASPTWRHVIDTMILCRDADYVVLIDTDVFIVEPIAFARQELDFVYNCDDIPGYRGKWYLPFVQPMVPAINPGFMLLRPQAVDLDALEDLVQRYFVDAKNYWWTRQSALSVVVGRSSRRAIFDGHDVRVFSGNRKRSPDEILQNQWKWRGDSRFITDEPTVHRCLEGAAVLHLAGAGKRWLNVAHTLERSTGEPRVLAGSEAPLATPLERFMIATRMFAIQAGKRRQVPLPPASVRVRKQ